MAVRLSALCASLPLPPGRFLVLISVRGWLDPMCHSAARRIRSIEKFSDLTGNQTHDLPICSTVTQPTTQPRAPFYCLTIVNQCQWHTMLPIHILSLSRYSDLTLWFVKYLAICRIPGRETSFTFYNFCKHWQIQSTTHQPIIQGNYYFYYGIWSL
jgi:hypothetical protein